MVSDVCITSEEGIYSYTEVFPLGYRVVAVSSPRVT